MSKRIVLQAEFKSFIDSIEKSTLNENQQVLLGTYGGTLTALNDEDTIINNNVEGCQVVNNCNGGNCVAGCGSKSK